MIPPNLRGYLRGLVKVTSNLKPGLLGLLVAVCLSLGLGQPAQAAAKTSDCTLTAIVWEGR